MATIAELMSRVYLGLKSVNDHIDLDEVNDAVVQAGIIRTAFTRQSTTNVLQSISDTFTPDELNYDITSLIGKGTLDFVEGFFGDRWRPIRVVDANEISRFGPYNLACAFYVNDAPLNSAVAYLQFSVLPNALCRIRYSSDAIQTQTQQENPLPDSVVQLIVAEAQNICIPKIITRIGADGMRDKADLKLIQFTAAGLAGIAASNEGMIKKLDALWQIWAFRDRSADSPFNSPTPSSKSAYGNPFGPYGYGGGGYR